MLISIELFKDIFIFEVRIPPQKVAYIHCNLSDPVLSEPESLIERKNNKIPGL